MKINYAHQVYRESSRLIIFIHGFAGSPYQFEEFFPLVDELGFDYCSIWVPGHGGTTYDFATATSKQWLACAKEVISEHRDHYKTIVVIAHSMGCLLTMHALQGLSVEGAVFWAPAISTSLSPKQIGSSIEIIFKKPEHQSEVTQVSLAKMGVPVPTLLEAPLWTPSMVNFLKIMVSGRKLVATMKCPTLVISSRSDETVPYRVVKMFEKRMNPDLLRVLSLNDSTHAYFLPHEWPLVESYTRAFLLRFI